MGFLKNIETATHLLLTEKLNAPFGQVNMPSYASEKSGGSPRFVAWENNGSVNASLDSIQSQANRIEPIFNNFADLIPATKVVYPNVTLPLTEVSHRAADAAIRYYFVSELEALLAGNPELLAKRNPTALLFGLWDSRRTQVKVQRIITSSVQVRNAVNQPTASSLTCPIDAETRLKLQEEGWSKDDLSAIGVGEVPSFRERGTLDTTGAMIERRVFLSLSLLDKYELKLRDYLKGLALVALLYPVSLELRSGTSLVRQSRALQAFSDNQPAQDVPLDGAFEDALAFARQAAQQFGIGQPETLVVDLKQISAGMKEFGEKKAKKSRRAKVAKAEVGK